MPKNKKKTVKSRAKDNVIVKHERAIMKAKNIFTDSAAPTQLKSKMLTLDGFDNFISKLGLNNDNALSAGTYEFNLVTRNRILLEAAFRGSWIVGKMISCVAEDMTRAGIEISTSDKEDDLEELDAAISRLKILQSLSFLSQWGRLYGGAIGVVQVAGQKLSTPLDPDTVSKDQFQGIIVYDRWQVNPVLQDVIDSGPDIGLPKYYDIVNNPATNVSSTAGTATGQLRVHFSRVFRYTGIDLPYFQAITEMMWGESVLERLWDRLIAFDNATMSSASLIDRANLRTVGIDGLREIIAAGGEAQAGLIAQFDMMRSMQVNEGLTLLDKNDTFASTAYSFAGLSEMMLQFGQQLAGACDIPLVRLFGQSPAGLSATGESDLRMYYDMIMAQQESKFRGPWELLLKVLFRSVYGKAAPKDLKFTFTPLWQMSALDKANIAKLNTDTVVEAKDAGLVSATSAMKELQQLSEETGLFSNISDEEISEADSDELPMLEIDPSGKSLVPETGLGEEPVKQEQKADTGDSRIGKMIRKFVLGD